ncbi:potassium channel family protein [Pseudomonas laurylsulfatiphila]|uniref:potassium channel family protein n=1 Tax=Pseudomonas laurylsulfatiphila TaxID=2011015 RepID=UPI003D19FA28
MEAVNQVSPNIADLWRSQPHVFNEWRARNDLPRLFAFLNEILTDFDVWLNKLPFGMEVVLRIVPTGEVFKGKSKVVIRRPDFMPGVSIFECYEGTLEDAKLYFGERYREVEYLGEFEPYFSWAKRNLGMRRFFIWDKANRYRTDGFIRGSCDGLNVDGCLTRAYLFRGYQLLKLGQINLGSEAVIGNKNLDFCDMDFLTISGGMHGYGSTWKKISYSSFRELTFESADVCFFTFYHCWMDKLKISDSKIQDLYFENVDMWETKISGSTILKLGFKQSDIMPFINNTELREFKFQAKKGVSPTKIATTYRLFRSAFQSCGLRQEASECYYLERVYERKSYFHPRTIDTKLFTGLSDGGRLSSVLDLYRSGIYEKSDLPTRLWAAFVSKVKMHIYPRYMLPLAKYRFKWLVSALESLLWGYGEKPFRILLVAFFVVSVYAGIYNAVNWIDADGNLFKLGVIDSLYFSAVTFTTLGYGDITPKTQLLKMLAGSEALCGAFIIGLIVAGFSNKSRY